MTVKDAVVRPLEIVGDNYFGTWTQTRTGCRGIVIRDGRILLSYESVTGQWMLPGGGLEEGENEAECCVREVAEETGILIRPTPCVLEIDEYYEDWKYINRYFFGEVTGHCEMQLTEREKEVGMEPRWLPVKEAVEIFSRHESYRDTDEMRRGMYLREYTALGELINDKREMRKKDIQDRVRGSLIGGAAGDALGYAIEFDSEESIFAQYGERGIQSFSPVNGRALISDDTQMTLFTAEALRFGAVRRQEEGLHDKPRHYAAAAYQDWLITQEMEYKKACRAYGGFQEAKYPEGPICTTLLHTPELFSRRAPGNTCLSSLWGRREQRKKGWTTDSYIADPLNHSKGCGGVMRAAPVGMILWEDSREMDLESAEIAAITHGHPLGYMPAAVLSHVVHRLIYGPETMTLRQIVEEARDTVAKVFAEDGFAGSLTKLIDRAIALSENELDDLDNIHTLGEGWVGDEALAIALYCSLKYENDFSGGLIAAVNHRGDSDSTGAITGNILGALIGYEAMEQKWKDHLELREEILQTADRLYEAVCQ